MIRMYLTGVLHSGARLHSSACLLLTGQPQKIILLFQDGFMVWKVSFQTQKLDPLEFPVETADSYLWFFTSVFPSAPNFFFFFAANRIQAGHSSLRIQVPWLWSPVPLEALWPELSDQRCRVHLGDTLRWLPCPELHRHHVSPFIKR